MNNELFDKSINSVSQFFPRPNQISFSPFDDFWPFRINNRSMRFLASRFPMVLTESPGTVPDGQAVLFLLAIS